MSTSYHAKYWAHELTKRCASDSEEKLAGALIDAQVDLNPHQVDAALFAFRSPLSKGAILADEVGLGKTIEAGLVISQRWAERKRKILIVVPSNLRKQWYQELTEKFFLPCEILEAKSYRAAVKSGNSSPLESKKIVICSYHFAKSKSEDVSRIPWSLVVIDEAHRLRNVYKPSNVIANTLKNALAGAPKILLTATPLQNSLLELYGLVSIIDDRTFGDLKSFREQFSDLSDDGIFEALKKRLQPVCHRTLRRQVTPYISYTKRHALVEPFTPDESEDRLYDLVTEYLSRPNLQALPSGQRALITLVLRKLLSSSTHAIASALGAMGKRLQDRLDDDDVTVPLEETLDQDYEALDEVAEEWEDEEDTVESLSAEDRQIIREEIGELKQFQDLALSIRENAKGKALLKALGVAFAKAEELGAQRKAIIFTESRRTQDYLLRILGDSAYAEGIVLFNGSNNDDGSKAIYQAWLKRHEGTDRVSGSKTADMRSALVDYFRDEGRIMIATEAGAEGINLQFCSLVVNYDLPWNPQRVEQRIGRCHRYGQKHDVVVVNFLNQKNAADQRVYELLRDKFRLFDGVFGTSDEVLGTIESGVDFEKRIAAIYQECRKPEQIKEAFDALQMELSFEINEAISQTRRKLLENVDNEVIGKLRLREQNSQACLSRFEKLLMALTKQELGDLAEYRGDSAFILNGLPPDLPLELARANALQERPIPENPQFQEDPPADAVKEVPAGLYELPRRSGEAHFYRLHHPLARALVKRARTRETPFSEVVFDLSGFSEGKISALEPYKVQSGWLSLTLFTVEALDLAEDHLLFSAITETGETIDPEVAAKLLTLSGEVVAGQDAKNEEGVLDSGPLGAFASLREALDSMALRQQEIIKRDIAERNGKFYEQEVEKLENWADDLKVGLEREIKEIDKQIKEARRSSVVALTLEEKLEGQKKIKALEATRSQKRRSLFEAQDEVDRKRENFIEEIQGKLEQSSSTTGLFQIRWALK